MMLKKLNTYFLNEGKILTEKEYMAEAHVPYRIIMIQKYLGGWPRMLSYLNFYYPRGTTVPEVEVKTFTVEKTDEEDL